MKHVFIINPAAGKGGAEAELLPAIRNAVRENDVEFEIHRSLGKQEIHDYVVRVSSEGAPVRFYAVGGDGTVNDVACGVVGIPNAELAVIPCGSGNDFVRNFTEHANFKDIRRQLEGEAVSIDVIKAGDEYAVNMFNIGVDCDVAARASEIKRGPFKGSLSYLKAAADILPKGVYYTMEYEADGVKKSETLMLAAIANGMFCGGGFRSCPGASLTDGLMDVCIVRPVKGLRMLKLLMEYHNGTHLQDRGAEDLIEYLSVSSFVLRPVSDVRISKDGEIGGFAGAEFRILPKALRFSLPRGSKLING